MKRLVSRKRRRDKGVILDDSKINNAITDIHRMQRELVASDNSETIEAITTAYLKLLDTLVQKGVKKQSYLKLNPSNSDSSAPVKVQTAITTIRRRVNGILKQYDFTDDQRRNLSQYINKRNVGRKGVTLKEPTTTPYGDEQSSVPLGSQLLGHIYTGPGTPIISNIRDKVKPTSEFDMLSMRHDIAYTLAVEDRDVWVADRELVIGFLSSLPQNWFRQTLDGYVSTIQGLTSLDFWKTLSAGTGYGVSSMVSKGMNALFGTTSVGLTELRSLVPLAAMSTKALLEDLKLMFPQYRKFLSFSDFTDFETQSKFIVKNPKLATELVKLEDHLSENIEEHGVSGTFSQYDTLIRPFLDKIDPSVFKDENSDVNEVTDNSQRTQDTTPNETSTQQQQQQQQEMSEGDTTTSNVPVTSVMPKQVIRSTVAQSLRGIRSTGANSDLGVRNFRIDQVIIDDEHLSMLKQMVSEQLGVDPRYVTVSIL